MEFHQILKHFIAVAQIPDITIGDVVPTLQDGTEVDSFEVRGHGIFPDSNNFRIQLSDVLITVNIFDVENTPLGLAYFQLQSGRWHLWYCTLGLQIPDNVMQHLD